MLLGTFGTPANPQQGAAFSALGYKAAEDPFYWSVGKDLPDGEGLLQTGKTGVVHASVVNSILTFTAPQTHEKLTSGDVVWLHDMGPVIIQKKLSAFQWTVRYNNMNQVMPTDGSEIVDMITKSFESIEEALGPVGISDLIGTTDFDVIDNSIGIVCLAQKEDNQVVLSDSKWTNTSIDHRFIIFSPREEHVCNKYQFSGINKLNTGMMRLRGGFDVDGVAFSFSGLSIEAISTINDSPFWEIESCKQSFNALTFGITNVNSPAFIYANNYSEYDSGGGSALSLVSDNTQGSLIAQNTVSKIVLNGTLSDCELFNNFAYSFDIPVPTNCIIKNNITHTDPNVNMPATNIKFIYYSNAMGGKPFGHAIEGIGRGGDSDVNLNRFGYIIRNDILKKERDPESWSVGCFDGTPEVPVSVSSTPLYGITATLLQNGEFIAPNGIEEGSILLRGTDPYYVGKQMGNGNYPAYPTTLSFIFSEYPVFVGAPCDIVPADNTIDGVIGNSNYTGEFIDMWGGGSSINLYDEKIAIKIVAHNGESDSSVFTTRITSHRNYTLTISGTRENTLEWNTDYYVQKAGNNSPHAIHAISDGFKVLNMQIESDSGSGIFLNSNVKSILIDSNYIKDCHGSGIYADDYVFAPNSVSYITRNIISKCYNGIFINSEYSKEYNTIHNTYLVGNNIIKNCENYGFYCKTNPEKGMPKYITLINNIINGSKKGDVFITPYKSHVVNTLSTITSDSTINELITQDRNSLSNYTVDFDKLGGTGFRMRLYVENQIDSPSGYQVDGVGFVNYYGLVSDYFKEERCYSVGEATGNFLPSPILMTVINSIATFDSDVDDNISSGDILEYDDGGPVYVYLQERGTSKQWYVTDAVGAKIPNIENYVTVNSITRYSNDLKDMLENLSSYWTGTLTPVTIVNSDDSDTTKAFGSNIVAVTPAFAPSYPLKVTVNDGRHLGGVNYRHNGVKANGYKIDVLSGNMVFDLSTGYVIIEGFNGIGDNTTQSEIALATCEMVSQFNIANGCAPGRGTTQPYVSIGDVIFRQKNSDLFDFTGGGFAINSSVINIPLNQYIDTAFLTPSFLYNCSSYHCKLQTGAINVYASVDGLGSEFPRLLSPTENCYITRYSYTCVGQGDDIDFELDLFGATGNERYVYLDKNIDGSLVERLSVGPWSLNFETLEVHFSLCGDTTSQTSIPNLSAVVESGIITFNNDVNDIGVGIGAKVIFEDTAEVILYGKITQNKWHVALETGEPAPNKSSSEVNGIYHFSNSLKSLWDPLSQINIPYVLTGSILFANISRCKLKINVWGYMSSFATIINGNSIIPQIVSDSVHFIDIKTPFDISKHCNTNHGPRPFDYSMYTPYLSAQDSSPTVSLQSDYSRISGFVISGTGVSGGKGVVTYGAKHTKVENNIISVGNAISPDDGVHFSNYIGDGFNNSSYQYAGWKSEFTSNSTISSVESFGKLRPQYFAAIFDDTLKRELIDVGAQTDLQMDFKLRFYMALNADIHIYNDAMNIEIIIDKTKIIFKVGVDFEANRYYRDGLIQDDFVDLRIIRNGYINSSGDFKIINNDKYGIYYKVDKFADWELLHDIEMGAPQIADPDIGLFHYQSDSVGNGISNMCLYTEFGSSFQFEKSEFNTYRGNSIGSVEEDGIGIEGTGDSKIYNNLIYRMELNSVGIKNMFEDDTINCSVQDIIGGASTRQTYWQPDNAIYCNDHGSNIQWNFINHNRTFSAVSCTDPVNSDYSASIGDVRGNGLTIDVDERDCTGKLRGLMPDRFGWEYSPAAPFIAVGNTSEEMQTGNSTYIIQDGLIFFSKDQEKIGVGMSIVDDVSPGVSGIYISEIFSKKVARVVNFFGIPSYDTLNGVVRKIVKPASDLTDAFTWISSLYQSDLLVARVQVNFAIYNDNENYQQSVKLSNIVTDWDHYIRIFAPNGGNESIVSQKHDGTPFTGSMLSFSPTYSVYDGMEFDEIHYVHIENLRIRLQKPYDGFVANAVSIKKTFGALIKNNFVVSSPGNGIYIEKYYVNVGVSWTQKFAIFNNVIQNCGLAGIIIKDHEDDSGVGFTNQRAMVSNNTVVKSRTGIAIVPAKESLSYDIDNNIVSDTVLGNYSINFYKDEFSEMVSNSCDDDSLRYFNQYNPFNSGTALSSFDIEKFSPKFINKNGSLYMLDAIHDKILINSAKDMSKNNNVFPYNLDIINSNRPSDKWDIGAFEDIVVEGFASTLWVTPYFDGIGFEGDFEIWADLYLRESVGTFLSTVPSEIQFTEIGAIGVVGSLVDYAMSHQGIENLRIHVEGGISFQGGFNLGDRNDRKVIIKTYEPEQVRGPGGIIYDKNIIDENDIQGSVEFIGLKIYHLNDGIYHRPFEYHAINIKFNNCIVGVAKNTVMPDGDNIRLENTFLLFRNDNVDANLYISETNSGGGHNFLNSSVLTWDTQISSLSFECFPTSDNTCLISNSLLWNYSNGTYYLYAAGLPSRLVSNIDGEDADPKLLYVNEYDLIQNYNSEVVFTKSFIPSNSTILFDKGNNSYVTNEYDIVGNERVYIENKVDIGPYELKIHQIYFDEGNIYKLIQGILTKYDDRQVMVNRDGEVFSDLYNQFESNAIIREDFVRSEKYILKLKETEIYNSYYNDKKDKLVSVFECYIDRDKKALFVEKQKNTFGSLFNNIFTGGYAFFFDERSNQLYVYIKDTFEKGCSGKRLEVKLKV